MTTAKRRFGQNFLVDRGVVDRIIAAVSPRVDETIIEIGPGSGALTARLLEQTGHLVAIEFDRDLVCRLLLEKKNNDSSERTTEDGEQQVVKNIELSRLSASLTGGVT